MTTKLIKAAILTTAICCSLHGSSQTIMYQWMNMGCENTMSCDNSCTACNLPENESSIFFGTNMIWVNTSVCPYPTAVNDLSVFSMDWPTFPEENTYGLLSGIASVPMSVDSIILRHARTSYGPERLKVSYTSDPAQPFTEVSDTYVDWNFQTTVITDLGCLEIPSGAPYAFFQLKVQAYEASGEGAWVLDEIKIVGTPCADLITGIPVREFEQDTQDKPYIDVLGRAVGSNAAPGVYMGKRKVVTIF